MNGKDNIDIEVYGMKRKIRDRYYKEILWTLLVISLIPVLFLGYYVISFVNQQTGAVYKSYAAGLENQKEEFETNLRYVEVSLIRLGLKNTCQTSVNNEWKAANFQILNTMKEELQLIDNTEEYLNNVYLVSQSQNWILGSTTSGVLNEYSESELIYELLKVRKSSFWYNDGNYLYLCKRIPINAAEGSGMLIAKFDDDAMIRGIVDDIGSGIMMVMDKDNEIMLGTEGAEELLPAIHYPDEVQRLYRDTDITRIRYQDESYTMLQSKSDYNGWKYIMLMPTAEVTANIKGILTMVVLVVIAFLVTNICAIKAMSSRLYQPIDDIDTVVKSGIKKTEYNMEEIVENTGLMDRLQYMVNKNVEMNQRLTHGKKDGQQLFLRRVYQGEIINPSEEMFQKNGFETEKYRDGTFFVMAVKYYSQFEDANDKQLYLFALDNIVNELIVNENAFPPVMIGSLMYITFCVKTDSSESAVMKMQMVAIMITTTVKKYINLPLNIGISQGFTNLQNIILGVNESNKALQNALGAEGEVNFYHSHHTTSENANGYAAKKKRVQLLHFIDLGEQEACRKELGEYIDVLSDLYYYMFKLEICKLVSEILSIYSDYALTPDYDKVGDIIDFDIGKTVNSYEKLERYLWEYLLEPLFDTICSQAKERDMMQQIVEYLLDNLEKDVSLEECARHFNYNSNYLSRWFKKKMGMTYTDFVTSKKMELCKTLLVDSDISVNELAERFGYSSPQNFIRVFKKYTLMTPGQYRKMEREKGNYIKKGDSYE